MAKKEAHDTDRGEAKGAELLAYLAASGTPAANLAPGEALLMAKKSATAGEVYEALKVAAVTLGTLRKAGQWCWGPAFEPETSATPDQVEELQRVREELARVKDMLAQERADKTGLRAQVHYRDEQIKDLSRELSTLKIGRRDGVADLEPATVG